MVMQFIEQFIEWCNKNEGFFSMLLSVVAIGVSIKAIFAQNRGAVFEKRLEIYCTVDNLYKNSRRIIETCFGKDLIKQRNLLATIMFDYNSREKFLVREFGKLKGEEDESFDDAKSSILMDYMDLYLEKYVNDTISSQAEIFYNSQISNSVKELVSHYDNMRLGILAYTQPEIEEWIEKLNAIVMDFEQKDILKKMKKELPI